MADSDDSYVDIDDFLDGQEEPLIQVEPQKPPSSTHRQANSPSEAPKVIDLLTGDNDNYTKKPTRIPANGDTETLPNTTEATRKTKQPKGHVVEVDLGPPVFSIRASRMANAYANDHFWSHLLYQDSKGMMLPVTYCINLEQSEAAARRLLLAPPVFGMDLEWRPVFKKGASHASIKDNVSLIQVATETEIVLFHVAQHNGQAPGKLIAPSLKSLVESKDILKTGVNIRGDALRLSQYLDLKPRGIFELSSLYKEVFPPEKDGPKQKMVGLAKQTQQVLSLKMAKGAVRTSNWSRPLSPAQKKYAAGDAYASYKIFATLDQLRRAKDPVPPMPPCEVLRGGSVDRQPSSKDLAKPESAEARENAVSEGSRTGISAPIPQADQVRHGKGLPAKTSSRAQPRSTLSRRPAGRSGGRERDDDSDDSSDFETMATGPDPSRRVQPATAAAATAAARPAPLDSVEARPFRTRTPPRKQYSHLRTSRSRSKSPKARVIKQSHSSKLTTENMEVTPSSADSAITPSSADSAVTRQVFSALKAFRGQLKLQDANFSSTLPSDDVLLSIAERRPSTMAELRETDPEGTKGLCDAVTRRNIQFFAFLERHVQNAERCQARLLARERHGLAEGKGKGGHFS